MHHQTSDFSEEVQVLAAALRPMRDAQWTQPTQFKQWTPEHILRHLHCWNEAADWAVHAPEAFRQRLASSREHTGQGGSMRDFERQMPGGLTRRTHRIAFGQIERGDVIGRQPVCPGIQNGRLQRAILANTAVQCDEGAIEACVFQC